ncbi:hypothetical protein VB773_04700 [Haloarculaceae archaeon H-GB2-1]|nr:hypothetical protein [Haloarculaceae archaeon H-GB1-1]MEA5388895.1 hypothetical protein [Haloarculaceae archaeon H-GB11]MEA5406948.1 hypothetical protein [Haloarculaceae archaeon H-GB2-1]
MNRKRILLWGAIGGLAFLVLVQGFELVSGQRVDWLVKFGVAAVVAVGAAAVSRVTHRQLPDANERT